VISRVLVLAVVLPLASCSAAYPITLYPSESTGTVAGETPVKRVVSLVPSMTEDLFAVGAGATVVGVSEYTDFPPQAQRLPIVATFASIATERIVKLHPDVAIGIVSQDRLAGDLRRAGVKVLLLHDDSYNDIFANLIELGALTGHEREAKTLVAQLHARTTALVRTAKRRARKPSVFVVLGTAPVFTVGQGSYIANLIEMAGGRNAAGDVKAPYARYSAEALVARQPDLLIVDPTVRLNDVLSQPPWSALRAVQQHRIYTLPDAAILERPGPRYNEGLSWLIATIDRAGG
jgi:ABC-type Fe3+-hydroxamate transport system substrate-binding protein